jgi:hypothetical protein
MNDELYGRIRGYLEALNTINNDEDPNQYIVLRFERLPEATWRGDAMLGPIEEDRRRGRAWDYSPVFTPVPDWRAAVTRYAREIFYFLLPAGFAPPVDEPAVPPYRLIPRFVEMLEAFFADSELAVWRVKWRNPDDSDYSGGFICYVRAFEFVFETAAGERYFLGFGHCD